MAGGEVRARGNIIPFIPARYIFAVLGSIAMAIIYGLKVNLSVAMVAMVNHTAVKMNNPHASDSHNVLQNVTGVEECEADIKNSSSAKNQDGPFDWTSNEQGIILSSWRGGVWMVVIMRILQGIGGGVTFPAEHTMISNWAPPSERSTISSIIYAGTALGTVISMLMAGMLADAFGWASIFYVMGGLSCIWMVLWVFFIYDTPSLHPLIDQSERDYIVSSLNSGGEHGPPKKIPWKAIMTSIPFLGILIAHTCNNWGWYMLLIELPIYMKGVLKFEIKENATYTAIPFFTLWLFSIIISKTLDTLRCKGSITTTTARKISTFIASFIPMCCMIALCFIGCNKMAAVFIAGVGVTSIGAMFSGFLSNHIDIAPNLAGILMAVTNTVATLPGITVPIFVGELTHKDPTIASWRIIFGVTIVLYIIEIFAYMTMGSGEPQPWNDVDSIDKSGPEATPLKSREQSDYKTKDED
ncbi:CLUMA_CG000152, isoform A [Clunio marinus]|uniref:CLUMA_CG000152, isoform A n=1 Tax=Clunio marinus TaxID=568069 RepID=A0A1J1HJ49_9DIPT|nr:CLUMA_CG000152, isoform A [Clunio marinus]